ncbi:MULTISPECIES: heavy-metal-associated domain-containing protein [Nonlabens]|uniref:heavy-metal-associated domain-containing protein n=1 Tax=Nonlabens TaxID=363408 RepID=UPI000CF4DD87|nr:heavy metal-associated domain-containing protein [Nonlabens tegetincola]PQJ18279.1 heavy metal transporter [Nonlabens tegetincola]
MKTSIIVQNLKCGSCAKTITSKLSEISNITDITVDIENSTIAFSATNSEDALEVKRKLKTLGYPTIDDSNGVLSKAKSFVSCATGKMK